MEVVQDGWTAGGSYSVEDEERKFTGCKMRMFTHLEKRNLGFTLRAIVAAMHPQLKNIICGFTATPSGHLRHSHFYSVLFSFSAFVYPLVTSLQDT